MFLMKEHVGKLISDVEELLYREKKPVESYRYKKAGAEKLAIDREDIPSWDTLKNEDIWGGNREYFYFQTEVVIPKEWRNCKVVYELRTGREGEWDAIQSAVLCLYKWCAADGTRCKSQRDPAHGMRRRW